MNPYVGDNELSDLLPENFKTEILPDDVIPKDLLIVYNLNNSLQHSKSVWSPLTYPH